MCMQVVWLHPSSIINLVCAIVLMRLISVILLCKHNYLQTYDDWQTSTQNSKDVAWVAGLFSSCRPRTLCISGSLPSLCLLQGWCNSQGCKNTSAKLDASVQYVVVFSIVDVVNIRQWIGQRATRCNTHSNHSLWVILPDLLHCFRSAGAFPSLSHPLWKT